MNILGQCGDIILRRGTADYSRQGQLVAGREQPLLTWSNYIHILKWDW